MSPVLIEFWKRYWVEALASAESTVLGAGCAELVSRPVLLDCRGKCTD